MFNLQTYSEKQNETIRNDNLQVDGVKSYKHAKVQLNDSKPDSRDSSPEKLITTRLSTNRSKLTSVIKNGMNKIKEANNDYDPNESFFDNDDTDQSASDSNDDSETIKNLHDENNDVTNVFSLFELNLISKLFLDNTY